MDWLSPRLSLLSLLTNMLPGPSASEVMTLWRYTNLFIIIIVIIIITTTTTTMALYSALTLLVGRQEELPACRTTEWWGAGVVICLERGADLHTAQLMPLPLTVSCFSKIQIGFYLSGTGSPG